MKWQRWGRFLAAIIGIAAAVVVYATMGERAKSVPVTSPVRMDPKAIIESSGNVVQQVRGTRQDYLIEAERQLTYEGGFTKLIGVKITVRNRGGRDYEARFEVLSPGLSATRAGRQAAIQALAQHYAERLERQVRARSARGLG